MEDRFELGRVIGNIQSTQSQTSRDIADMKRDALKLTRRVERIEKSRGMLPRSELFIKMALTLLIPAVTLAATGSWQSAIAVLRAISGDRQ